VAVFADHIDVRPKAVSKATGLQWLMEMTGIAAADVLAVGDDETDLDVFAIAGQSAAPSNASEVVKAAAGFVSSESYTDGVCEILEEIAVLSRP
jgi:hydroxymethylpyrimidine pyrophosphatase-like HAD family hydrolase